MPSSWDSDWGDLSATIPVLAGEWGEYLANKPECVTDAPSLVPQFLTYLSEHDIGLIAWTLAPGVLAANPALDRPTTFPSSPSSASARMAAP